MAKSYKARKEEFVSNLTGGDIWEINAVILVAQSAVLLWSALQAQRSFFSPYSIPALVTDFLLNVLAILFAITLYSSAPVLLNILLVTPTIFILLGRKRKQPTQKAKPPRAAAHPSHGASTNNLDPFPVRPFLTLYRGGMMVTTCLAILAVDFRVFPRRFAKVENWGTSLMDLGVGSFVFSGGVVSARSILVSRGPSKRSGESLPRRLLASIRHSIPLLALGLIRLYSVKGLDYAEHVSEYGVHWNFFFTLAFLPPFVEVFHALTTIVPSYEVLSLFISIIYQVLLESTMLKEYILVSPRGLSLLSKNREGVFSFLGYLAIFLSGRATGLRIIPRETGQSGSPSSRKKLLIRMAIWTSIWTILFTFNSFQVFGFGAAIPVSRRLANMPYVLWVIAFNNFQLLLFYLSESVFFPSVYSATDRETETERSEFATSKILGAFNKNGLAIFLIANLLTGAVNLKLNTLDASREVAMGVLIGYATTLTAVALTLDRWNVKLKI
ncbi:Glucosaminyl phosphatidylinositol (GlcN-PI) nositol acylation protein [Coccidioides posadasii str. Silveira]|uniref:GPI-anchored wall transfer protein n=3 Tax=Coccidioides posadasii TaxID=199306 RepID=E9CY19_COCPS|nr:GPI-anchored wall transfer protein 1, putative [Coccidioides posadasii C735 delta SOWgp]EER26738.1 GPI-anchored wall transfer protein 1, putative [Coccidioides posadasii C735 delta SOWgp]EFW20846.1 GPI-anchored wall transfer protein [Coccidioides posadasii str. Silveira]KMM72599.1 GPI-anchored wall transfer protein 1 [Coccidioides posadasii RMSCC 3488]QVM08153.1 Glucosaminyl phosphatidylinositol (GlcN-PI) nositol acylation protein [Coccidioides posadasii str. Silveira]|eukprot:XP_003068883.1 GPI-anchored wall transfer protein 1, putative [Coccidioides posadasii C735 delta SOWgp]